MARKSWASLWAKRVTRSVTAIARSGIKRAIRDSARASPTVIRPAGATPGDWLAGVAIGPSGARRYRLYRPPGLRHGETVPLLVMLHGCRQDAKGFAASTRMNRIANREHFLVLYPEQDRISHAQGCWNWYDTKSGRAYGEASLIMTAVDQVCLLYPVDRARIAVAGLSAGASMAGLLASRYADRFKAVVMHSGVPPGTAHSTLTAIGAMRGRRASTPLAAAQLGGTQALPPLLVIQGGSDALVSAANGRAAAALWGDARGAHESKSRIVKRGKRYAMTVSDFKCSGRTVATLVAIEQLGHAWSGGAHGIAFSDAAGPDASRMVWTFAAKQFGS